MATAGCRVGLAAAVACVGLAPSVSSAYAPAFRCRDVTNVGSWQRIPIAPFLPIVGVASQDVVTSYSLAPSRPERVVVTNGKRLSVSDVSGCAWSDGLVLGLSPTGEVPLTGTTSTIVSTAVLPSGRVLAAVQEGSGPASRPHVVGSEDGRSGHRLHDTGLPPQGAPRFLESAADGRTVYLVLTPSSGDGGLLPGLPDATSPTNGGRAGLLYASTDSGRTWALRTDATDLPAGGGGLDSLAIDPQDPQRLYALSNGLLLLSTNGGGTFRRVRVPGDTVTAVETGLNGRVVAFTARGLLLTSNGGGDFVTRRTRSGVTSAAARRGDGRIAAENNGRLALLDPVTGASSESPDVTVTAGSLIGDVSEQASYHALSGHSLLRFADPPPRGGDIPVTVGDLGVPPPPPGRITPSDRAVTLTIGTSTALDYTLDLPKSPTPLDLMFLIDTSGSMTDYITNLKANINKVTGTVQSAGIDLQVGVATLGSGPLPGESVGPYLDPGDPSDRGPQLYELLRRIGPIDADFAAALGRVQVKEPRSGAQHEGQLAALEQATAGLGIKDPQAPAALQQYLVPPGQGATWRPEPSIRRVIVHATDEEFDSPAGSPMKNGKLDFAHTIALMNAYHVQQIGLTVGSVYSRPDLARIASGTKTFAPPDGADCGQKVRLRAGEPVVCVTEGDFSAMIGRLVRGLTDRQTVGLRARGSAPRVVGVLDAANLHDLDVTVPHTLPLTVTVSCKDQPVGRYTAQVVATLREVAVASTGLTVDCVAPALAARLTPEVAVEAPLPPPPAPPGAVVPAPPAAQPAAQPMTQVQTQVNPMTAAALQEHEELQLALALQPEDRPQPGEVPAWGGRRGQDETAALALLGVALTTSAAFGAARLRSTPAVGITRAAVISGEVP